MRRIIRDHQRWLPLILVIVGAAIVWGVGRSPLAVVVRTVAFLVLMAPMPSVSLIRTTGLVRDRLELAVVALIASLALVGATGFLVIDDIGHAWGLHAVLLVYIGITAISTLISGPVPSSMLTGWGAALFALALAIAVAGSATLVHFLVPAAPVETAFDMVVDHAAISSKQVTLTVDVTQVGRSGPETLTLSAAYHVLQVVTVTGSGPVTLIGHATPQTGDLCNDLIKVTAPNSSYLTPVLTCKPAQRKMA